MSIFLSAIGFVALLFLALICWRRADRRTDSKSWLELIAKAEQPQVIFDATMVEGLPEPAQRYFRYSIEPNTPLAVAAEIDMHGELCMGTKEQPKCRSMTARQLLAPPHGLVWSLKAGSISGSDGATPLISWTRFWLYGVIPIVRVGRTEDHHRSAFGRVVAEGAFWVPASLLPSQFVRWESVDHSTARAIVIYGEFEQAVEITVAENGQPTRVVISRWSNENPEKQFREQPFGGELSEFKKFGGYMVPTHVIGGNHIGTADYFPFYRATVASIRLLPARVVK